jgi:SAM-dependent methyltransferase
MRRFLPLGLRRRVVLWASRRSWLPRRSWWSLELLRDWAAASPADYHRWVWRHHAAFPEIYDPALRFAAGAVDRARLELFEDLTATLRGRGIDPATIGSVLEVGSSLGYLLRLVELDVFPSASVLEGVDIDRLAVEEGNAMLRRMESRVRLHHLDAADLDAFLRGRSYDIVYCAGTLMYLDEGEAAKLVATMLRAAKVALAITGVAHPLHDNATMAGHSIREWDAAFVHNLDAMVLAAGGEILFRRWDGQRIVDGISIYHLVAARGQLSDRAADEPGSSSSTDQAPWLPGDERG